LLVMKLMSRVFMYLLSIGDRVRNSVKGQNIQ
jgi:hypothetical protein